MQSSKKINQEGWILCEHKKKRNPSITHEDDIESDHEETDEPPKIIKLEENRMNLSSFGSKMEDESFKNRYLHVFCLNCGKKGHLTKKCNYPIISLGIIATSIDGFPISLNHLLTLCKKIQHQYLFEHDELETLKEIYEKVSKYDDHELDQKIFYLMIQRKNSLSYVDFIRGKYDLDDFEYIYNTISMMTIKEQQDLLTHSFEELWSDLWACPIPSIHHNQEYLDSKMKYQKLKDGYMIQKCEIQFPMNIKKILDSCKIFYEEAEWGFPKGRRNLSEKNIECAKREFQEETGIMENEYHILNLSPLEEIYLGSNHIRYKHIYYFAQMIDKKEIKVNKEDEHQKSEVGDIRWVTVEEGFLLIRDYHKEKRNILTNSHEFLKTLILHFCYLYQEFYKKNKIHFIS